MAVSDGEGVEISRLARFGLTTADADKLAGFYERALGFRRLAGKRLSGPGFEQLMDIEGGARSVTLCLGDEIIELLEFDRPGRPYPSDSLSSDLIFQHFAIVAADIDHAYRRLAAAPGWSAISPAGPQRLPAASGGVTAFKFRDPEGHPLELLAFPEGGAPSRWRTGHGGDPCLGIDHSAISISDSARAAAFYEELGFQVASRSLNRGPEQGRLDGLPEPVVEVTALAPSRPTPHVELLCYRPAARGPAFPLRANDIAATRLMLEASGPPRAGGVLQRRLLDPDGHHLIIDWAASDQAASD